MLVFFIEVKIFNFLFDRYGEVVDTNLRTDSSSCSKCYLCGFCGINAEKGKFVLGLN
jgi:hypothetical protein